MQHVAFASGVHLASVAHSRDLNLTLCSKPQIFDSSPGLATMSRARVTKALTLALDPLTAEDHQMYEFYASTEKGMDQHVLV